MKNEIMISHEQIQKKIYYIRNMQVMLDSELAELYDVSTKRLNEQVKRNIKRFPEKFRFQLTKQEKDEVVANCDHLDKLKFSSSLPYVFSEPGVTMLSSVLNSESAIQTSIQIMDAFVSMRKFIKNNAMIFQRLDNIEQKQLIADTRLDQVLKAIEEKDIKPTQGLFFEGQIFDAYVFVSALIKSAKSSIILIDNYIDETILTLLSKRVEGCKSLIYTRSISQKLQLDLDKHNAQYPHIKIKTIANVHDRFLLLDRKEVYHLGASLKDLGKKLFAFSKLNIDASVIMDKLEQFP